MKIFFVFISLAVTFISFACKDSGTNNNTGSPELTIDKFPLTVGSTWMYEVNDYVASTHDTLNVHIVNTATLFGTPVIVFQYVYTKHTDTMYVTHIGDTIRYYSPDPYTGRSQLSYPNQTLIFPLHAGNHWGRITDSSVVTIVTPYAKVVRYKYGPNRSDTTVYVYENYLGLNTFIERGVIYHGPTSTDVNTTWILLSADIKQ